MTNDARKFTVLQNKLPELQSQITKLAKRAAKLGVTPPNIKITGTPFRTMVENKPVVYVPIEVTGDAPVLPGWSLVAIINVLEGEGIVKSMPGVMLPDNVLNSDAQWCDHCRTRRVRNDTFVLQSDDGVTFKQVGRQCLKDFIPGGHTSPDALAWWAHALDAVMGACRDAGSGGGISMPSYVDLAAYLSRVAQIIRTTGWVSRKDAFENDKVATADRAINSVGYEPLLAEDTALAEKTVEWMANLSDNQTEGNEFLHNLRTLGQLGVVDHRTHRIAAAAVTAFQRETSKSGFALLKPVKDRAFLGTVGTKITVKGTVLTEPMRFDGQYGVSYLYKFAVEGNEVEWFSKNEEKNLAPGKTVTLTGNVKEHKVYQGRNSNEPSRRTLLNYVKVA